MAANKDRALYIGGALALLLWWAQRAKAAGSFKGGGGGKFGGAGASGTWNGKALPDKKK